MTALNFPIKLLTPWGGELPRWFPLFRERILASTCIDWELIEVESLEGWNRLVAERLGTPCRKESFYAMCDAQPMLAHIYPEKVRGYPWWGFANLDICFGNLDKLLVPLLDDHDLVSMHPSYMSGACSFFRNVEAVNGIYRTGEEWRRVLADPEFQNYDEDRIKDGGFSDLVRKSGLRVHYVPEEQSWCEGRHMEENVPSRRFHLVGGDLVDHDTGEEAFMLHLGSKVWPLLQDGSCRWYDEGSYADRDSVYRDWGIP